MEARFCLAPILPPEVLETILKSLDFETIKNFRLVCRHWNFVARPYLSNLSTVCLSPKDLNHFNATYSHTLTNSPFSSFKIQGNKDNVLSGDYDCVCTELDTFLDKWRHAINSLEFYRVNIQIDEWDDGTGDYGICPILQSGLETLILDCSMTTSISVSVEHLTSLKIIKLTGGAFLKYNKETKLTPKIIELRGTIFRDEYVLINDFIDFSEAKKVCLHQGNRNKNELLPIDLALDMRETITLDDLDLKHIRIHAMHESKWEITRLLSLSGIPWRERNEMIFTNLHFHNHEINIAKLPETIEYIGLVEDHEYEDDIDISLQSRLRFSYQFFQLPAIILPNLKFLSLDHITVFPVVFKNCPNLRNINFYGGNSDEKIEKGYLDRIEADYMPHNISKMHIKPRTNISSCSNTVLNVEILIVNGFIIPSCLKMLGEVLSCKKLVMILNHLEPNLPRLINNIHKLQDNIYHRGTVVYIGPVKRSTLSWVLEQVDKSTLDIPNALCSNSEEYWFSFENKVGKTISEMEFDRLSKFPHGHIHLPNYSASVSTLPIDNYY